MKKKKVRLHDIATAKEHVLKKLYLAEAEGLPLSPWTPEERAALPELEKEGLIRRDDNRYSLTERGKEEGAAIVRKHRIYETYLAKKTGFDPAKWHQLAEKEEHLIDAETLKKWEKELGFPVVDPHGDIIPDEKGVLEKPASVPMHSLRPGTATVYKVVHVEDEPEDVYLRLLHKGFYPGMIIRTIYRNGKWHVEYEGLKTVLSPAEASLISVISTDPDLWDGKLMRLSLLEPGEKAVIVRLSDDLQGLPRQRLLDLGFVPDARVSVYLRAPLGEPVAYDIKGSTVALRKEQAAKILVKKTENGG